MNAAERDHQSVPFADVTTQNLVALFHTVWAYVGVPKIGVPKLGRLGPALLGCRGTGS